MKPAGIIIFLQPDSNIILAVRHIKTLKVTGKNHNKNTLGFYTSHKEDVFTEYSGMRSEVVQLDAEGINFPIIEPASSKKQSQIAEFSS
jgi:4-hydroxyphenylpyruvate dioxygenase-like putative hemolysin